VHPPDPSGPPPPPAMPGIVPERRRTGLLVLAIVVPVVLALGLLAGAGYLVFGRHGSGGGAESSGSPVPVAWPTAGFVVSGPGASGTQVRQEVGRLLTARAGKNARYTVRPHGVTIAAPTRDAVDRVRALAPLQTDVEFRPVVGTATAPPSPSGPPPTVTPASPTGPPPAASASASPTTATGVSEQLPSLDGRTSYQLGPVAMSGTVVRSAAADFSQQGNGWEVSVALDATGTRQFADLTARLQNQQLAIVVAGRVVSAPTIESAITGGQIQISGSFNRSDAEGLAAAFQLGEQPVTVTLGDPS
jgi:preprotein translocase subunit SecD